MVERRSAEATARVDAMIAAFATAMAPKALEAWVGRQRGGRPADGNRRALANLAARFPDRVRVS